MNAHVNQQDPLFMQADGQWCFYSHDRQGFFGPYATIELARQTLAQYIVWLNEQGVQLPAVQSVDTSDLERATAEYMALRAQKAEINERHKNELAGVDASMAAVEAYLLDFLNRSNLKNFAVGDATVYTEVVYQAGIGDKGALMDFIRDAKMPELLQARVSSTALKQYVDAGNPMPPGVKVNQERVVRVRSK